MKADLLDDVRSKSASGTDASVRVLAVVSFLLSSALVALALSSGGFGATIDGSDLYGTMIPKFRESTEILFSGRIPLWNPWEYCGVPILALAQGAVLYPPVSLAFALLEPFQALQLLYAVHIAAYVFFVLIYLTRCGVSLAAAIPAAVLALATSFNGYATLNIDHPPLIFGVTYLPALLVCWLRFDAGDPKALGWMAILCGIPWLTGYPQMAAAIALMFGVLALTTTSPRAVYQRAGAALLVVIAGAMIGAIQILPVLEASAESTRQGVMPIHSTRLFFVASDPQKMAQYLLGRYGGPAMVLGLLGLCHRSRYRLGWAIGLCWATFPMNWPFSLIYELPLMSSVRTAFEFKTIAAFFFACLVASGIGQTAKPMPIRRRASLLSAAVAVSVISGVVGNWHSALLSAVCALVAIDPLRRRGAWILPIILVCAQALPIIGNVGTRLRWEAPDLASPSWHIQEFKTLQQRDALLSRIVSIPALRAGVFPPERIASPTGIEPALPPRRMSRLLESLGLDERAISMLPEKLRNRWRDLAAHPGTAAVLGVGFVLLPRTAAKPLLDAGFSVVAEMPPGEVVVYKAPVPRFHIVHSITASEDEEQSLRMLLDPNFDPWTKVIMEEAPSGVSIEAAETGRADLEILEYEPERIRLRTDTETPGILVTSEAYYPGWEARIDGREVQVLRSNYTFRSIALPAGAHEVEFRYRPSSFRLGAVLSTLGLLFACLLPLLIRVIDGRRPKPA